MSDSNPDRPDPAPAVGDQVQNEQVHEGLNEEQVHEVLHEEQVYEGLNEEQVHEDSDTGVSIAQIYRVISAPILILYIVMAGQFLIESSRLNKPYPLFGFSIAFANVIGFKVVNRLWSYLGRNHWPRLLAGTRRRRIYYTLRTLTWFGENVLWIYLWACLDEVSRDVSSITRSLLEVYLYWKMFYFFSALGITLFFGILLYVVYRNRTQQQMNQAGARAADSNIIKEKTSIERIADIAKEMLDAAPSCSICMEDYEVEDEIRKLGCGHFFHCACIDEWLKVSRICPYCRQEIADAHDLRTV